MRLRLTREVLVYAPSSSSAFCRGKNIVAAAAGNEHTALLSSDGTIYTCGYNDSG